MAASILWYDLETWGTEPSWDRIAQFACIRTDENLERIEEPEILYCRPGADFLPNPVACLVHGILPQEAMESGLPEFGFATKLHEWMSRPATTAAGYNSMEFDERFIRHLLYRNLFDIYAREWREGNSRWDIIDLMRAARDLRPAGIVWPQDESERPIFKLEVLAKANGIEHRSAHDALSDVEATIGLARLLKARQPRLYRYHYAMRFRNSYRSMVDLSSPPMLVHVAKEYTSESGCTTLIAPISLDPKNENRLIAIDLRYDPEVLVDLPVEEIRRRIFTKAVALDVERVPLSTIRLKSCPFLAPASTLKPEDAERLHIDREACSRRHAFLARHPELLAKLVAVFSDTGEDRDALPKSNDPELRIYESFVPAHDKQLCASLREAIRAQGPLAAKEAAYRAPFRDARLPELVRRLYWRNFPETLSLDEAARWRAFCAGRIQSPPLSGAGREAVMDGHQYSRFIEEKLADPATPARDRGILQSLLIWKKTIEDEVLALGGS
jgi:exodeoxyribonuclease-1